VEEEEEEVEKIFPTFLQGVEIDSTGLCTVKFSGGGVEHPKELVD
jgi:hypothetical protein